MTYLKLIWKHRLATLALLFAGFNVFFLGFTSGTGAFLAGTVAFLMGFLFPVAVANVQVNEEEAAEEARNEAAITELEALVRAKKEEIERSRKAQNE